MRLRHLGPAALIRVDGSAPRHDAYSRVKFEALPSWSAKVTAGFPYAIDQSTVGERTSTPHFTPRGDTSLLAELRPSDRDVSQESDLLPLERPYREADRIMSRGMPPVRA